MEQGFCNSLEDCESCGGFRDVNERCKHLSGIHSCPECSRSIVSASTNVLNVVEKI